MINWTGRSLDVQNWTAQSWNVGAQTYPAVYNKRKMEWAKLRKPGHAMWGDCISHASAINPVRPNPVSIAEPRHARPIFRLYRPFVIRKGPGGEEQD